MLKKNLQNKINQGSHNKFLYLRNFRNLSHNNSLLNIYKNKTFSLKKNQIFKRAGAIDLKNDYHL